MQLVIDFKKLSKNDVSMAGGKGASLGEMTRIGIPVPPGFVVTAQTFDRFLAEADLTQEIEAQLDKVNYNDANSVDNASRVIHGLIESAVLPEDMAMEILKHFAALKSSLVAVRSSATAEDSSTASWAGELESFLNTNEENLFSNIKKCWASLFTPRAIVYRLEKGMRKTKVSVAVVIQKMVQSEIAGISFTVHPVTQDHNQMIHEAVYGLGEAIVSGELTPDSYVIHKNDYKTIDINIAPQEKMLVKDKIGSKWIKVLKVKQSKQKLNEKQIIVLTKICQKIEDHYGFSCDIEWGMEKNRFYIVQSRPITTLKN